MTAISEKMNQLLSDPSVSEIMVDGPEQVYVERQGQLEDTGIRFAGEREVIDWANGMLAANGWEPVGEGRFWAEGRLPDWGRFVIVIPPVSVTGPNVVIRKFPFYPLTWPQLLEWGCVSQTLFDFFKVVMRSRLNVLVSGGTASGKTTLANLLVELIPPEERLITVSQRQEFRIDHRRVVHLEAEAARASGGGEVTVTDLLRLSTNMRPDRLIVGELLGPEVIEVIRLMNLGHEGTLTLIHANSPRDALARLETMATVAEPSLTLPAIRAELASALHLIIQQSRLEDGSRKVVSVAEVQDLKGDSIVLQELFRWEKTGLLDEGPFGRLTGVHKATGAVPSFVPFLSAQGLAFPEGMFEA
ncbi:MAG: CpaF family protein [Anaerolineae bacterium]|nr:CpaF family protein [Anaerolineae bacterium]